MGWSSGLLALLLGCGEPAAERTQYGAEQPDYGAGELVPTPVSAQSGHSVNRDDPAAQQLLDRMIARYRSAEAYADNAHVRLSYRQGGQKHVDQAPLAVALQRPGDLHLRAYAAEVVIRDQRVQATILDPQTGNMDAQQLDRPLSERAVSLTALYSDPTLTHFATAGLGGPAPQLELLLSAEPLAGLFDSNTALRLGPSARGDRGVLDALIIETDQLTYTLWIERESLLLKRVELPPAAAGLDATAGVSDVQLTIELADAAFALPVGEDWQLATTDRTTRVTSFVPPPPPLVSPHLGRPLPEFQFVDQRGDLLVSHQGSDRPFTVMLWIADHSASQLAARQLQQIADRLAAPISEKTRFVLVMAEASAETPAATGQMLRRWSVGLPYVDDLQAIGRDVFHVREAPTLCVLGQDGVMHWFHPRVGPEMTDHLSGLLSDLAAGKDVGGDLRKQYEKDRETYRKLLDAARP